MEKCYRFGKLRVSSYPFHKDTTLTPSKERETSEPKRTGANSAFCCLGPTSHALSERIPQPGA